MSAVLLLDTNVWSHLVLGTPEKSGVVKAQLAALRLKYPGSAMAVSSICIAECMVAARRLPDLQDRVAAEAAFQVEFSAVNLIVVDVTRALLDKAATLRAEALRIAAAAGGVPAGVDGGKLKLPDAIIAATCLDFDPVAVLVTENVRDFQYLDDGGVKTFGSLIVETVG